MLILLILTILFTVLNNFHYSDEIMLKALFIIVTMGFFSDAINMHTRKIMNEQIKRPESIKVTFRHTVPALIICGMIGHLIFRLLELPLIYDSRLGAIFSLLYFFLGAEIFTMIFKPFKKEQENSSNEPT